MNRQAVLLRESLISVAINMVISVAFFLLVFGLGRPMAFADLGPDFLPQAFMVALMGSLVPPLLLRGKLGLAARPIVVRAIGIALVSVVFVGGGAFAICAMLGEAQLAAWPALALKAAFGGLLAMIVTPVALTALFKSTGMPS